MKKFLTTLCVIALVLICVLTLPTRADAASSGTCGENVTWTLDDQGTLTITGTGEMWGGNWDSASVRSVIIGDGITNIDGYAFYNCESLTSVTIGNDVEVIGEDAFNGCTALKSVVIPDSVTKIDTRAFCCENLSSVTLGDNLTTIGYGAFMSSAIEEITFPDSLTSIGDSAFFACYQLKSLDIPDGVALGNHAFYSCESLTSVRLPSDLKELPDSIFGNCYKLSSLELPAGLTKIGVNALNGCRSLEELIIGDHVTVIEEGAIGNCGKLDRLSLPAGLTTVGNYVFDGFYGIDIIYFRGTPEQWANISIGSENYDLPSIEKMYFAAPENLTSISISQRPKYVYYAGEELDLTGLRLTGTCADGTTVKLTDMHLTDVSSVDMNTVGKKDITVTIGSCSTTVSVGVHNGGPRSVSQEDLPSIITVGGTYVAPKTFTYPGARELTVTFGTDNYLPGDYSGRLEDSAGNITWLYNRDPSDLEYFPGSTHTISGDTFTLSVDRSIDAAKLTFSSIVATVIEHDIVDDHCTICGAPDRSRYIDSGSLGDNIRWMMTTDGTLTISGSGAIPDFTVDEYDYSSAPWAKYTTYNSDYINIVIEEGITHIGDYALYHVRTNRLTLPASLKSVGTCGIELAELIETYYGGTRTQMDEIENISNLTNWITPHCKRPDDITEISINWYPDKINYIVNEELDLTGIWINLYCADGRLESGFIEHIDEISDVDMSTPGLKEVTLYVGECEVSFPIYVHSGEFKTLDASTYPESTHNYANNTDDTQTFTYPGATELTLTFSNDTLIESGYDGIEIYNKDGSYITLPEKLAGNTITIPGDSFSIRIYSDDAVVSYGYSFSSIVAKVPEHSMSNGHCTVCSYFDPDDFAASGSCGENTYWTLDEEGGTLVVFGYGTIWSDSYMEHTFKHVVIEEGITRIGGGAFSYCEGIEDVTLPDTLTFIESSAFVNCTKLTEITIPDSVAGMDNCVFEYCSAMETVVVGSGMKELPYGTFQNCTALKNVTMRDGLTLIDGYAFSGCSALESITIPDTVTTITNYAFSECSALKTVNFSSNTTTIGNGAFANCSSLTEITLPEKLTIIDNYAFNSCSNVTTITIPETLTRIGEWAFSGCENLKRVCYEGTQAQWSNISIEAGNEYLKNAALFYAAPEDITSLTVSTLPKQTVYLIGDELSLDGLVLTASCASGETASLSDWHITDIKVDMEKAGKQTVTVYVGEVSTTFQIGIHEGSSVVSDGAYPESAHPYADDENSMQTYKHEGASELVLTFSDESKTENECDRVQILSGAGKLIASFTGNFGGKSVTVPGDTVSVHFISDSSVTYYGYAFSSIVAKTFEHIYEDGFCTVCGAFDPTVYIDMGSFEDISWELTTDGILTISGSGEMINNPWYLYNEDITSVVIEGGITTIGSSAFDGCLNLKSVSIPNTVTKIQDWAFSNCMSLENVEIPEYVTYIGENAFRGCSAIAELNIPDSVTQIVYGAFRDCTGLTTIELPKNLEAIDSTLFMNCTSLESINLPDTVYDIRWASFQGCTSLKSVEIPNGVIELSVDVFRDCTNLETVILPESLMITYRSTFEGCPNLKYTEYENGLYLGNSFNPYRVLMMMKDDQSTTFNIHENTKVIAGKAFSMSMLTSINIPDGVEMICDGAFSGCSFLTEAIIPESVNYIGKSAFSGCERLKSIALPTGIAAINEWTFYNCAALTSVTIPGNVRYISSYAFYCCSGLQEVILKSGVNTIEYEAFACCYSLKKIVIPVTVDYIGYSAFYDCGALDTVLYGGKESHRGDIYDEGDNDILFEANWHYDCDETSKGAVIFKSGDTVISSKTYNIGDPITVPAAPTKKADNTYTYTFAGWDKEISTTCQGDVTYNATFKATKRTYTVIFKDADGTQLSKKTYNYGATITVPANPTKASTNTYSYTFNGWDKDVSKTCKGSVTYTATYKQTKRTYTVTFKDADGTQISKATYNYGAKITIPAEPTKASTNTYKYTFSGWDRTVSSTCKGNATYTATYKETKRSYTVTFKNEDGSIISSKSYTYGVKITVPANPTKASTNTYTYAFAGWDKDVSTTCKGSVTYTAKFNSTKRTYTVTFKNQDGTVLSSKSYAYGAAVTVPTNPTQKSTSTYVYTFEGWNKTISKTCKGAATYTATYSAALHAPDVESSNNSSGKPVLKWGKVSGAAKYEIYRATSKTGKYTKIATITKTSYTDKEAKAGKTYYYKVRAVSSKSGIGKSVFSAIEKLACTLKTPTIKVTHKQDDKQNVIKWSKISGAKKYVVQVKIGSGKYKTIATTTKTSYTHKKIEGGKVYTYRVIAKGASSAYDSDYSATKKITAKCAKPTVTVKLNKSDKPVLKWKEVDGAKKYQVYFATSKNGKYKLLTTTTKETYTHKKAADGKTYFYKVRAVDAKKGVSNYSAVKSIKVK